MRQRAQVEVAKRTPSSPAFAQGFEARALLDALLATATALALVLTTWAIRQELQPAGDRTVVPAARVGQASLVLGAAKRRAAQDLVWQRIALDEPLERGDGLFVPGDGLVEVRFVDGTILVIEPNSMVVLDAPESPETTRAAINLRRGGLSGVAGARGAELRRGDVAISFEPAASASVSADSDESVSVRLHSGRGYVSTTDSGRESLATDEIARFIAGRPAERQQIPVELVTPAVARRIYFSDRQGEVEFAWRTSEPAVVLELADDRQFQRLLFSRDVRGSQSRVGALSPGAYYWRVRHPTGVWSTEPRAVTLVQDVAPQPIWPGRRQVLYLPGDETTVFLWSMVAGVRRYEVQIARDAQFRDVVMTKTTSAPQLHLGAFGAEGIYHWRVRAVDAERVNPPFSTATPFRLIVAPLPQPPDLFDAEIELPSGAPSLSPPSKESPVRAPRGGLWGRLFWGTAQAAEPEHAEAAPATGAIVLRWRAVVGIERYQLEIADGPQFVNVVLREDVPQPYYRWHVVTTQPHWWRVRSIDAKGRVGLPSAPRRIEAMFGPPVLAAPSPGARIPVATKIPDVALVWHAQPLATRYQVEVARDERFSSVVERQETREVGTRWQPVATGLYYWRVRALGNEGAASDYSAARTVRIELAAPRATKPLTDERFALGSEPVAVMFQTSVVAGAAAYEVQLSAVRGFEDVAVTLREAASTITWATPEAGLWHWRVRAIDAAGTASPWSAPSSFQVLPAATPVIAVEETAPLPAKVEPVVIVTPTPTVSTEARPPVTFQLGAALGWYTNFARWGDPTALLELGLAARDLPTWLGIVARVGYHRTAVQGSGELDARAVQTAIPMALGVRSHWAARRLEVYGDAALTVALMHARLRWRGQPELSKTQAAPGVAASFGVSYPAVAAGIFGEVGYHWLRWNTARITFDDSGLRVVAGYRVRL